MAASGVRVSVDCHPARRGLSVWWAGALALLTGCTLPRAPDTGAGQHADKAFSAAPVHLPSPPDIFAPPGWTASVLPGRPAGADVVAFSRRARLEPARYRVLVIPGSGCTRSAPVAERYFSGLLHADVVVLHKPHVDLVAGWHAPCTQAFVAEDALDDWRDAAVSAVTALPLGLGSPLPWVVVGVSEGAELLPAVVAAVPGVSAMVMVSASGLDPVVAGALQAQREGHADAWRALETTQASGQSDNTLVQGRTLRYWRGLWRWSLTVPLMSAPWPLLRVWGDADASVPPEAYLAFNAIAAKRRAPFCDIRLSDADHGLQTGKKDGIQWLWNQLEHWARQPESNLCNVVRAH